MIRASGARGRGFDSRSSPLHVAGRAQPPTQAKPLLDKCVEDTKAEAGCLYYGWTIKEDGSKLFCRETYVDGAAAGHHLSCVAKSGALGEALEKGYIALDNIDLMGTESDIADAKKAAVDASSADVCLKFWNESQTFQEPRPKPSNSGTFFASAMSDSVPIRSMLSSAM